MRHGARALERYRTPGKRLSSFRLTKHRLINSLWTKVSERSEGVCPRRCPSALLNHPNFVITIAKPTTPAATPPRGYGLASGEARRQTGGRVIQPPPRWQGRAAGRAAPAPP